MVVTHTTKHLSQGRDLDAPVSFHGVPDLINHQPVGANPVVLNVLDLLEDIIYLCPEQSVVWEGHLALLDDIG